MSTLTIELSDELAARLAAAAEREQVPPSTLVQKALEKTLPEALPDPGATAASRPSALELLADLVGCFDSGVSDLATNPKHLEGFGQWRR